ncbi:MAG TPA: multicopper oxidase family protein [Candidatus Elarobacter sp.]|jgi:FtsP/CotA-like multicopper oxidase with cupredoxin domain|nr:multicopper oxidase family protein [Candidatus Elarobacter sp.]
MITSLRVAALVLGATLVAYGLRPTAVQPQAIPAVSLPALPEVRSSAGIASLTLTATETQDGHAGMSYGGGSVPPTLRVSPGDQLQITYVNNLPAQTAEKCALGPCMDMTNLHFHGMTVSPHTPQDNVLTMIADPGQTLHYDVRIPAAHVPGIFWYHTHPHGESAEQALDGMSGAIVVDGIDRYAPQVRGLRERVLVVRTKHGGEEPMQLAALRAQMSIPAKDCGTSGEQVEDFPTVNGALRPSIAIAPGERQFWRVVNAEPEAFLDLSLDGATFNVVALDGEPLAFRNPVRPTMTLSHVFVPPAGRVEAIVTGPPAGAHAALRTLCVDTGPAGDINPAAVLADIVPAAAAPEPMRTVPVSAQPPVYKSVAGVPAAKLAPPSFTVIFTEHDHGFFINNQKFALDAKPMTTVHIGSYQHWRIVNKADEMHPFHIHQVHFLTYSVNGRAVPDPVWLDTVNVPKQSTVDVVLDFTDPVIRGMAVFHCHILNHEDKGMMAKVLFK